MIFVISWPINALNELCLALDDSEFSQLFKDSVGLKFLIEISWEKCEINMVTFFLRHPVYIYKFLWQKAGKSENDGPEEEL